MHIKHSNCSQIPFDQLYFLKCLYIRFWWAGVESQIAERKKEYDKYVQSKNIHYTKYNYVFCSF
jgi:hypothetical protein